MAQPKSPVDNTARKANRQHKPRAVPTARQLTPPESGGTNLEVKWESRCRVCAAGPDLLGLVNQLLGLGATYSDVFRSVQIYNKQLPANKQITRNSINNHQKRHLPFEATAVRRVMEMRAEQIGKDIMNGEQNLIDDIVYAETMARKGFKNLIDEKTKVSPSEGLQAAAYVRKALADEAGSADILILQKQVSKIIDAVKRVCSEAQWKAIVSIMESDSREVTDGSEIIVEDFDDDEEFSPVVDEDERDDLEVD